MYPDIEAGDEVKVMRKHGVSEKEKTSHWVKPRRPLEKKRKKLLTTITIWVMIFGGICARKFYRC